MSDLWISIAINVIKGFVFVYDVLTYIPRYIIEQPYKKLALSDRLRVITFCVVYVGVHYVSFKNIYSMYAQTIVYNFLS